MADMAAIVLVFLLLQSLWQPIAKSVLIGQLIFFIPNSFFAWRTFRDMGASRIKQVARGFYLAETTKFALTVGLFAYSFMMLKPINVTCLFTGYAGLLFIHQCVAFFIVGRRSEQI